MLFPSSKWTSWLIIWDVLIDLIALKCSKKANEINIMHDKFELNHHRESQHKLTHNVDKISVASLLNLHIFFGTVLKRLPCLIFPRSLLKWSSNGSMAQTIAISISILDFACSFRLSFTASRWWRPSTRSWVSLSSTWSFRWFTNLFTSFLFGLGRQLRAHSTNDWWSLPSIEIKVGINLWLMILQGTEWRPLYLLVLVGFYSFTSVCPLIHQIMIVLPGMPFNHRCMLFLLTFWRWFWINKATSLVSD